MALFDPFYTTGSGVKYFSFSNIDIDQTGNFYQYNSTYCYITYKGK